MEFLFKTQTRTRNSNFFESYENIELWSLTPYEAFLTEGSKQKTRSSYEDIRVAVIRIMETPMYLL